MAQVDNVLGINSMSLLEFGSTGSKYNSSVRRSSLISAKGDASLYLAVLREYKRSYVKSYSPKKLRSLGFSPSVNGVLTSASELSLLSYIQLNYDVTATSIIAVDDNVLPLLANVSFFNLQHDVNFDPSLQTYTFQAVEYSFVSNMLVGSDIISTFDDVNLADYLVSTSSVLLSTLSLSVSYLSNNNVLKYYIEDTSTVSIDVVFDNAYECSYIIPLKEDNTVVPLNTNLKSVLNNLGLGYSSLLGSISQSAVEDAYIMYGIPLLQTLLPNILVPEKTVNFTINSNLCKVIFLTLSVMASVGSNISIKRGGLEVSYIDVDITIVDNVVWDILIATDQKDVRVGDYFLLGTSGTSGQVDVIFGYRTSVSTYTSMLLNQIPKTSYTIRGTSKVADLNNGADDRLLVPLDILNSLSYRELVDVHEYCLNLISFSISNVTLAWYQTTFSKVFLLLGAIVVGLVTNTLPATLRLYVVSQVITQTVSFIVYRLDLPPWVIDATLLAISVVELVYGDPLSSNFDSFFKVANAGLQGAGLVLSIEQQELLDDIKSGDLTLENAKIQAKKITDQWTDEESVLFTQYQSSLQKFPESMSIEEFVNSKVSATVNEIDNMFNLDIIIQNKKQVHSGF